MNITVVSSTNQTRKAVVKEKSRFIQRYKTDEVHLSQESRVRTKSYLLKSTINLSAQKSC